MGDNLPKQVIRDSLIRSYSVPNENRQGLIDGSLVLMLMSAGPIETSV